MKHAKLMTAGVCLVAALVLAGCGEASDEANEANLKSALRAHYAETRECFDIGDAPDARGVIKAFRSDGQGFGAEERGVFEALAQEGILERTQFQKEERNFSKAEQVDYTGYTVSAKGQSYLQAPSRKNDALGTGALELCYAARQIIDIVDFTKPAETQGVSAVHVTYTYKLVDSPQWASSPALTQHMGWLPGRIAAASLEGDDDLVLTNKGWVHHSDLKQ